MDKPSHWTTISQAAQLLGKSERTVRRWEKGGKLPSDRTGPGIRVDIGALLPDIPEVVETVFDTTSEVDVLRAEAERLRRDLADCQAECDRLWTALDNAQAIAVAVAGARPRLTDGQPRRRWWELWKRS